MTKDVLMVDLEVPSDALVKIEDSRVTVTGPKGSLNRVMAYPGIKIEAKEGRVVISSKDKKRTVKAVIGTFSAHIKNMINGVTKGFTYRLKVVYAHFPLTVKPAGDVVAIDNFLGEKTPRKSSVVGSSSVSVKGDIVTVSGINLEDVSQTAANIELATKISGRDRRVFQDGVYIISKEGDR